MRKILFILLIALVNLVSGQDIKPIDPINFKNLQSPSFSFYTIDSSVWIYKGAVYGWTKLASERRLDFLIDSLANAGGSEIDAKGVARFYFSGTNTKTLTLVLRDSTQLTESFVDLVGEVGSGDNWGSDVVNTDITLLGNGTTGNILKVDTTRISTRFWTNQQGFLKGADTVKIRNNLTTLNAISHSHANKALLDAIKASDTLRWATDLNTTYSAGTGLNLSGTTFNHSNTITAGTTSPSTNQTPAFGATFTVPKVTYDAQGHITAVGTQNVTLPANPNTDNQTLSFTSPNLSISGGNSVNISAINTDNQNLSLGTVTTTTQSLNISGGTGVTLPAATQTTAGLFTATDKTKLDGIASGATQYTDALARSAISLTTTGNSGAATYNNSTGVLNVPNYTLAGLGFTYPSAGIVTSNGSSLSSITNNSENWNTAYGWGNHAGLYLPLTGGTMANTNLVTNMNADRLDGQDGTFYDQRRYNRTDNFLGGGYISGGLEKPNWAGFGGGKLKHQMLSNTNVVGAPYYWNDVLWISSYTGSDVKGSNALVFDKGKRGRIGFVQQDYDALDWGTYREFYHTGNFTAGTHYQAPLTNPVTGTGTTNYVTKWTGLTTQGNSQIFDNGTNVGIGTTNPTRRFDIRGTNPVLNIEPNILTGFSALRANNNGGPFIFAREASSSIIVPGSTPYAGLIASSGTYPVQIAINNNISTTFASGGNVGIGTTTPTQRLDVNGNARFRAIGTTAATNVLGVTSDGTLTTASTSLYQAPLTNPVTGTGTTNYLPKWTGLTTQGNSRIFDNGTNVGIGTTNPPDI